MVYKAHAPTPASCNRREAQFSDSVLLDLDVMEANALTSQDSLAHFKTQKMD